MRNVLSLILLLLCSGHIQAQSKIVFSRNAGGLNTGGTPELMMYDTATGKVEKMYKGSVSGRGEYGASVSPDNTRIITNTYKYGGWKLGIAEIVNGKVIGMKKFTTRSNYEYNGRWSHDGNKVAYQEFNWGTNETDIFIADKDGKNVRQLTTAEGADRVPVWTRDDKHIVFSSGRGLSYDIFIKPVNGAEVKKLTGHIASDFAPSTSSVQDKIAFLSDRGGRINLYTMDYDGGNLTNLTAGHKSKKVKLLTTFQSGGYWAYQTSWSPDGKKIVFCLPMEKGIELFIVDADGNNLTQITNNTDTDFSPYWMN